MCSSGDEHALDKFVILQHLQGLSRVSLMSCVNGEACLFLRQKIR